MGSIKKKRRKKMSKHKYDKRMKAQRHKNKYARVADWGLPDQAVREFCVLPSSNLPIDQRRESGKIEISFETARVG